MNFAAMMLIAVTLDACLGWPDGLYRRIGHPVTWIGALIARLDRAWNNGPRPRRLALGTAALALVIGVVIGVTGAVSWGLQALLPPSWAILLGGVLAWPLIALRSMHEHVAAVAAPLEAGDPEGARHAVSMIVGRDPALLDEAGIARATLESLAENTSDGIVAPVFWGLVAGLPGIAVYKAINTGDSMIGHRSDRYEAFGKTTARLDDLVNLIPARLTGLLFAVCSGRAGLALRSMWRDAPAHRSPNAGWPEAALAAALDVRLSGPRTYGDRVADEPWLNAAAPDPAPAAIDQGLALYRKSMLAMAALLLGAAVIWGLLG